MLDLGSSVNLLPYHINTTLGLGELEPTACTLQFVDRYIFIPRGTIEDVLVQAHNFVYPVDFIVLNTQPTNAKNDVPIILGRPFLSTSKALINCRDGHLNISFEDMNVDLNIFKSYKVPKTIEEVDEVYAIDLVDSLVEDHYENLRTHAYDKLFGDPFMHCTHISNSIQEETDLASSSQVQNPIKKEDIPSSNVCYMKRVEETEKGLDMPKEGKKEKEEETATQNSATQHLVRPKSASV